MKKTPALAMMAATALLLWAPALRAQDKPAYKPFVFGISGGMLMPGEISIARVGKINTSMSPFFKAHFDAFLMEKLSMGLYASYLTMTMNHLKGSSVTIPDNMNGASGFEIGGTIKPCFKLGETVSFKPGIEFGYRQVSPEVLDEVEGGGVDGFALNTSAAIVFKAGGISPFIAPGFISQPVGGNDFSDVTWAPIFTITGGIEF